MGVLLGGEHKIVLIELAKKPMPDANHPAHDKSLRKHGRQKDSIAALCFFYVCNIYTLGALFERDLNRPRALHERRQHVIDVVLGYLSAEVDHENRPDFDHHGRS